MELLGILLKINVSLLVFYLVYRFALRKLTFYNFNRFYLMAAIAISAIIPFLKYSNTASNKIAAWQQTVGIQPQTMTQYFEPKNKIDFIGIAENLYWAGVLVMAGIFLVQLASLIALYSRSRKTNYDGYSIHTSKDSLQAFSFFKSIFVNPHEHSASDLDAILKHENVHVKQWHSIDIIAGEMKRIFCWFNPAAWLMLAAIRENLEFIADRKVLQNGTDKKTYQYVLLHSAQQQQQNSLSNHFNFSHLKMRITMMNKTKSSDLHLLKYLLVVPVLGAVLLLSQFAKANEPTKTVQTADVVINGHQFPFKKLLETNKKDLFQELGIKDEALNIEVLGNIEGAMEDSMRNIIGQFLSEDISDVSISTITQETGKPTTFEYANVKSYKIEMESKDGMDFKFAGNNSAFIIDESNKSSIEALGGQIQKKDVVVYVNDILYTRELNTIDPKSITEMEILNGNGKSNILHSKHPGKTIINIKTKNDDQKSNIVYLLDGKEISSPKEINGQEIVQSNRTIGDAVQKKYPKYPKGTMVVEFITDDSYQDPINKKENNNFNSKIPPVIYLDGELYDGALSDINPNNIKDLTILKDKTVQTKYPEIPIGTGVIEITTNNKIGAKSNFKDLKQATQIFIYPNPTSNSWKIDVPKAAENDSYEIYDIQGKKRSSGRLFKTNEISAKPLEAGVYILKMKMASGNSELRLQVVK